MHIVLDLAEPCDRQAAAIIRPLQCEGRPLRYEGRVLTLDIEVSRNCSESFS
jgi:hypothetical protein